MRLDGRLDAATSPSLEERLRPVLEGKGSNIVFDCSALSYVSSAGLRVFLMCQRQLAAAGAGVAFASLGTQVRELFRLAGLEDLFIIEETTEGAARRLREGK